MKTLLTTIIFALAVLSTYGAEITLSWSDNSDNETGFEMQRSLDGVAWATIGGVGPNVTTMTDDPPLDADVSYRVLATGRHSDSGPSNVAVENTRSPVKPSNLKIGIPERVSKFFNKLKGKKRS
jgi:hypothetical protein